MLATLRRPVAMVIRRAPVLALAAVAGGLVLAGGLLYSGFSRKEDSPPCKGDPHAARAVCVSRVAGVLLDGSGQPVPERPITLCGPRCFQTHTDRQGHFEFQPLSYLDQSRYALQPHGGPGWSSFYYALPTPHPPGHVEGLQLRVLSLPDGGEQLQTKADLSPGTSPAQTVRSAGVMMSIAEGTTVRLAMTDALHGPEGRQFRALELSDTERREFAPELLQARIIALSPFDAEFQAPAGPRVSLRFDNIRGWPAGNPVEVLALGSYLEPDWLPPSRFSVLGEARVSVDGRYVVFESRASAALRRLTWIALRYDVR